MHTYWVDQQAQAARALPPQPNRADKGIFHTDDGQAMLGSKGLAAMGAGRFAPYRNAIPRARARQIAKGQFIARRAQQAAQMSVMPKPAAEIQKPQRQRLRCGCLGWVLRHGLARGVAQRRSRRCGQGCCGRRGACDGGQNLCPLHKGRFGHVNCIAVADKKIARFKHACGLG